MSSSISSAWPRSWCTVESAPRAFEVLQCGGDRLVADAVGTGVVGVDGLVRHARAGPVR